MRWIVVVAALAACQQKTPAPTPGSGSGSAELPAQPPTGADCQLAADVLASFDLGNYAEPEERAPVVGKYKAACESLRLTVDEARCVSDAVDRFTAARCAPRLLPDLPAADAKCAQVAEHLGKGLPSADSDAYQRRWQRQQISRIWQACERDKWPDEIKSCIVASEGAAQNPYGYRECAEKLSPDLLGKLDASLTMTQPGM